MKLSDQLDVYKRITGNVLNDNQEFKTSSEVVDAVNEYLEKNEDTPADWGKINDTVVSFLTQIGYKVDFENKTLAFVEENTEEAPKKAPVKVTTTKGEKASKDKGTNKKDTTSKKGTTPNEAGPDWTKVDFEQVKSKTKIDNVKVGASRVSLWVGGRVFFKIVVKNLIQKLQGKTVGTCTNATDLIKMINENWPSDAVISAYVGERKPTKKKEETKASKDTKDSISKVPAKDAENSVKVSSSKGSGGKPAKTSKVEVVEPVAEAQVEDIESTEGA